MSTLTQFMGGSIKSIQRGTISISSSTTATATISSVNTSKVMLNYLGLSENTLITDNRALAYITLTNATTVTATRGTSSGTTAVSYEVIEYN